MTEILDSIDAAIEWLESPEYLAQTSQTYACSGMHDCPHCANQMGHMDGGHVVSFGASASVDSFSNADPYRAPATGTGPTRALNGRVYEDDEYDRLGTYTVPPLSTRRPGTVQLTTRTPWWDFRPVVQNAIPFRTYGSFHGERQVPREYDRTSLPTFGYLDRDYRDSVMGADYVVYSYDTPIAWRNALTGWWWIPNTTYSVTTSRHQSKIRTALHDVTVNE